MLAWGMAAPVESATVPTTRPVSDCAWLREGWTVANTAAAKSSVVRLNRKEVESFFMV